MATPSRFINSVFYNGLMKIALRKTVHRVWQKAVRLQPIAELYHRLLFNKLIGGLFSEPKTNW